MRISELIALSGLSQSLVLDSVLEGGSLEGRDLEVKDIALDSRQVAPGTVFCALPGTQVDGAKFAGKAIESGAVAVLAAFDAEIQLPSGSKCVIMRCDDVRSATAKLSGAFYRPQPKHSLAVTGTNGKTSVANFTRQLFEGLGYKAISVGTLGMQPVGIATLPSLTSPDAVSLHRALKEASLQDYDYLIIEASSHGLDQRRLEGLTFEAAAFTNFSRDHLDYHADMDDYFHAKARLFKDLLDADGTAVLNADIPEYSQLAELVSQSISFGRKSDDIKLFEQHATPQGQHIEVALKNSLLKLDVPLIGAFQAENVLASIGLLTAQGLEADGIEAAAASLQGVPGRMEMVSGPDEKTNVLVDYAHTPEALEIVLQAARPHVGPEGRLICVFGAGGDRDAGKRPLMGQAAETYADLAIVTDDNPRSEPPAEIRRQVLGGMSDAREIGDRSEAIAEAIKLAGPNDLVVLAGKGHEQGQTIAGVAHPFSDLAEARKYLAQA